MKTKVKKKAEMTEKQARRIEEREYLKKWLGATVYANPVSGELDGIFYLVTAVDVVRAKIRLGDDDWHDHRSFKRLKSAKRKHWKRETQFVQN